MRKITYTELEVFEEKLNTYVSYVKIHNCFYRNTYEIEHLVRSINDSVGATYKSNQGLFKFKLNKRYANKAEDIQRVDFLNNFASFYSLSVNDHYLIIYLHKDKMRLYKYLDLNVGEIKSIYEKKHLEEVMNNNNNKKERRSL